MMEARPTAARILILMIVFSRLKTVRSRDFTIKDIIHLHPSSLEEQVGRHEHRLSSTATPHPGGFKCFTCQDAADNYECNRWAPDIYCPNDTRYCYTLHMMDHSGDSVSVTKRCATLESCRFTGCVNISHNGFQVCTSCCEGNICNILVPRNDSSAVFSSTSPLVSSDRRLRPFVLLYFIISSSYTAGCN
ncbi:ly6/PLAUR domain-containing protein 6 isoform X1 [Nothobranchius furzeri]|uniref:Transcript variant X1 n=2 Tax=Nothobranchius TaxID=28779 RepID=A0A9D2Y7A3_NOTFU|nr:transcript variant X1 [Nothobranchius furzeri]